MDSRYRVLGLLLTAVLGSCATQSKRNDADLAEITVLYSGRFTNTAQVEADKRAGRTAHAALELNIARIYAPRISDFTYYVQESAAEDPRRIFTQRLVAFKSVKNRGVVQSLWTFTEPVRWRDAHLNTDLFKGMTTADLSPMTGCDLVWTRKDADIEAANDQAACRVSSASAGGLVRLKLRAELTADGIATSEEAFDVSGKPRQSPGGDPFYRFLRR